MFDLNKARHQRGCGCSLCTGSQRRSKTYHDGPSADAGPEDFDEAPHQHTADAPRFDREAIHAHVAMLHQLAKQAQSDLGIDGVLVLACYGENPKTGGKITNKVTRYAIGDVDHMVDEIMGMEGEPFRNVYIPWHIMRPGLTGSERGTLADIVAVLALVVDWDADTGKNGNLPLPPQYVVETSLGNTQPVFVLSQALPPAEATPIAKAMQRMTKTDFGTGDIGHVWRVPGTLNWPNKKKLSRGRPRTPQAVRVAEAWKGDSVHADVLRGKLGYQEHERSSKANGSGATGSDHPNGERATDWNGLDARLRGKMLLYANIMRRWHGDKTGLNDTSRSGMDMSMGSLLKARGFTYEDMCAVLRAFPHGKGPENTDRDLERIWERSGEEGTDADTALAEMNEKYCVIRDGGRTRVLTFEKEILNRQERDVASFLTFQDFRNFYCNSEIWVGKSFVQLGGWWLTHPNRRQYDGVVFRPGQGAVVEGKLNLWRGWGIKPKPGTWALMQEHLRTVLAAGDEGSLDYITKWIAWTFQHPDERAEVALVFRGKRGTGKGTLGNALCRIFGQHSVHISSADHLAGRFNAHLRDTCLLFADEAYWPGDKGAEGTLKRLITEPDLFIEAKGRDGVSAPNYLHVVMASNEDWIVPAGEAERRFAAFDVADTHLQDAKWFGPLYNELENGGCAAMLHDLLRLDLGDWHPRNVPKTNALRDQQAQSLSPEDQWWCELLEDAALPAADPAHPGRCVSNDYVEKDSNGFGVREIKHQGLYSHARKSVPRLRNHSDHALARFLRRCGCISDKVMRHRGWQFPPLAEARAAWERRFPGHRWQAPEVVEWQK